MIELIAFDADDTLWHNEQFYKLTEERFASILAPYAEQGHLRRRLLDAERRNIRHYGFGIKGFTLSMIETAIEVTEGKVPAEIIGEILEEGRNLLAHPVEVFEGVVETLESLRGRYKLALVTKGDLFDQERKLAGSGLDALFDKVEIVSDKTPNVYSRILRSLSVEPSATVMVGNSLKSDIHPMLDIGAWAIFVPHEHEWALERAEMPLDNPRFRHADHINVVPAIVGDIIRG